MQDTHQQLRLVPGLFFILVVFLFVWGCGRQASLDLSPIPPRAQKIPHRLTIHGDTRIDNYYWLNQRENPEVIDYLKAENAYTDSVLAPTRGLQKKLYKEMLGRIKKSDESVPYFKNGYWYYSKYVKNGEYPIYLRKKALDGEDEVLLDVNELARGYSFYQATGLAVSTDNHLLAFGEDTVSRRKYTIRFKNLDTGEILADRLLNTTGGAVWAADNQTVFYVTKDSTLRPHKIWRHKLGTNVAEDVEIYHESDNTFVTYVYKSKSDRFIYIASASTLSSETRFLPADRPEDDFRIIQKRAPDYEYRVYDYKDSFYILTNYKAENFRLMQAPISSPGRSHWEEIIPHRKDVLLQGIEVFDDFLVLNERKNGLVELRVMDQKDGTDYYIDFGEEAYTASISINPEMASKKLRFAYTSMTTPYTTYDYNMETREKTLLKQDEVLGGFDSADYHTERLYAPAEDGTPVPISLVYRKGLVKDGSAPLLIYGYGSYGYSMEPRFSSTRLSLLDRGFVYAIAHIRGGQEMGRYWYEDGKLLKKRNTFTDFTDCARYLVQQKFTSPEHLYAQGGSAGGLLMGAVANLAPDLFHGIIANVPFVDVVTTMLDETIPLTTGEYDEWGNPNKKKYYDYMLSYSPYDNVTAKAYPALLVTTGLHDSQVQYWEPAKWVAKLRALKTDSNPLLLKINMSFGHGGASGRFERLREEAMEMAFIFSLEGITK